VEAIHSQDGFENSERRAEPRQQLLLRQLQRFPTVRHRQHKPGRTGPREQLQGRGCVLPPVAPKNNGGSGSQLYPQEFTDYTGMLQHAAE